MVDVRLRRAAVAVAAGVVLPPGFLTPGAPFPDLPASPPVQQHQHGGHVLLEGAQRIAEALGNRQDLMRKLLPGPVVALAHAPLVDSSGTPVGSVEAFQFEGGPEFTAEGLARLRHLASVRGARMATAFPATARAVAGGPDCPCDAG